jgi:hypothetical protein
MSREAFEQFFESHFTRFDIEDVKYRLTIDWNKKDRSYRSKDTNEKWRYFQKAWEHQQARIDALQAELAAMKAQEPVAWRFKHSDAEKWQYGESDKSWYAHEPLYTAPQAPAAPVSDHIPDAAQMVSERELPPLPDPETEACEALYCGRPYKTFTEEQMREYAQAAIRARGEK